MLNWNPLPSVWRHFSVVLVLAWTATAQSPPVESAWATWTKRSSREVEELIEREGPTKPEWLESVPFDHPKSLDLS